MPYNFSPPRWQDNWWNYGKWVASLGAGAFLGYEAFQVSDGIMNYVGTFPALRTFVNSVSAAAVGIGATAILRNIIENAELSHYMRRIGNSQLYRTETQAQVQFTEQMRASNAAPNLPAQPAIPGLQPAQPPIPVLPARYRNRI